MNGAAEGLSNRAASAAGKELKQERAIRTREGILRAASQLFADKGYPSVTILDVAQLAGMTKGAVYFHYTNKEALAHAVTSEFYERLPAIAQTVEDLGLSPLASVAELLTRTALALRDDTVMQAGARLQIERALIGIDLPVPFQNYTRMVCAWLEMADEQGELQHAAPPRALARVIVSAFFGTQHISWVLHNRSDIADRTLEVIEAVLPSCRDALQTCPSARQHRRAD
ncbi:MULTISPECIES: ScbR family autoregulator-binding transcription factor [unclassified Streptomyces]|uniref:ScbR family autoregulator-binding transcription factor n=1 Tax=unclassified Streptomyces TaxID=2593676 RepID=UPI0020343CBD|nr:ScbR family autoregulator-binding transcription factor [Streptomyces sp. RKAG290]MCM2416250.1 TetR/AcrR family transcriptional regulator [Streptomyces sp. RKAG290]